MRSSATGPDINAKGEGQLNIVNWEGYTDPSFVKGFEKETGCKVNDTFAGTSDEMFTKFRSGGGGQYDLASFSGDASMRAIKSGSVAELDTSKLTNFDDLAQQLQSPSFNTAGRQALRPVVRVGRQRPDLQRGQDQGEPRLLGALYDPKYKGKITVPDNPIQIADPALQFFGADDPYAIDQATLDKVKDKLRSSGRSCASTGCWRPDFDELFKSGDATIGAGWPLMTNDLRKAGMNVKEVMPKEGVTGWSDSWMLSTKAKHPICAYQYMNYLTKPDIQVKLADVTGVQPGEQEDV